MSSSEFYFNYFKEMSGAVRNLSDVKSARYREPSNNSGFRFMFEAKVMENLKFNNGIHMARRWKKLQRENLCDLEGAFLRVSRMLLMPFGALKVNLMGRALFWFFSSNLKNYWKFVRRGASEPT